MRLDAAIFPAVIQMIAEKDCIFPVSVIIEDRTADRGAAEMIQRGNIELQLLLMFHTGNLTVQVFACPIVISDMGVSVEMRTEIFRKRQELFQKLTGSVSSRIGTMGEGEDRFLRFGKFIPDSLPLFFCVDRVLFPAAETGEWRPRIRLLRHDRRRRA